MKIVWDEPKRLANIEKHGLDFAVLGDEFFLASTIRTAKAGPPHGNRPDSWRGDCGDLCQAWLRGCFDNFDASGQPG